MRVHKSHINLCINAKHSVRITGVQAYAHLQVELDHGREGARTAAGCPPSESSRAKVYIEPLCNITIIFLRVGHAFAVIVPFATGN